MGPLSRNHLRGSRRAETDAPRLSSPRTPPTGTGGCELALAPGCSAGGSGSPSVKARAFTLIELLVVVAVIAILAALLLAALGRARSEADSTVCRNNLRQITLGISMYVDDYRAYPGMEPFEWGTLVDQLRPYTRASYPEYNYRRQSQNTFVWLGPGTGIYANSC